MCLKLNSLPKLIVFVVIACVFLNSLTGQTDFLSSLVYDPSKTYEEGDSVIPSEALAADIYTALKTVSGNKPPVTEAGERINTDYWATTSEYTAFLASQNSAQISDVPDDSIVDTGQVANLGTPSEDTGDGDGGNGGDTGGGNGNSGTSNIRLSNISTRGFVGTRDDDALMIVSFIIEGTGSKTVTVRALGPVLSTFGVSNVLANPYLEIKNQQTQELIVSNDNWKDASSAAAVTASGKSDGINDFEAAVQYTLSPGQYSAIVSGADGGTGNALVEVYDEDSLSSSSTIKLSNISTRGFVGTRDDDALMIVSFIIEGTGSKTVTVRALGPVLSTFGVSNVLANPYLEIKNQQTKELIVSNDNWKDASSSGAVTASGKSDGINDLEAAVQYTLSSGQYSAIVSGADGGTGNALVEVYDED
jgi:hypothetical protein